MDIDILEKNLDRAMICLAENKALDEELACEGPISFEDESVTLDHYSYQKDSRKLLLQHINVLMHRNIMSSTNGQLSMIGPI